MTESSHHPDGLPQHDEGPGKELHGLIEPDRSQDALWAETRKFIAEFDARMEFEEEIAARRYFSEEDKPRSRRTWIYSHSWNIDTEGYELTHLIAEDAARLAANCNFELMLSSANPELGPRFSPDLIAFNGRGDAHDDFTYPPDRTDRQISNFLGNHGRCRTECRDYDTLVCAVLLSVKHHLEKMSYVSSTAQPDTEGWQAAFELYSRTFPEREIPWLNEWPQQTCQNPTKRSIAKIASQ